MSVTPFCKFGQFMSEKYAETILYTSKIFCCKAGTYSKLLTWSMSLFSNRLGSTDLDLLVGDILGKMVKNCMRINPH